MIPKTLLSICFFLSFQSLFAQYNDLRIVKPPQYGFESFRNENPYIVGYKTNGDDTWIPDQLLIRQKATNVDYTGFDCFSMYDNNSWIRPIITLDSFVLDGSGKITTQLRALIDTASNDKRTINGKFNFTYNIDNNIETIESYWASSPANPYDLIGTNYRYYNASKQCIKDSSYDTFGGPAVTYYSYDPSKNIITSYTIQGADSTGKTIFSFSNNLLTSINSYVILPNATKWTPTYTDTFEYNTDHLVSKYIHYEATWPSEPERIDPFFNESYTYTSFKKLETITRQSATTGSFENESKTVFTYDANQKPIVGYLHRADGAVWYPPSYKYFFSTPTGINPSPDPLSNIHILPNPANDILTIDLDKYKASVTLFDITGKSVYEQTGVNGKHTIDVSSFDNGMYYATIRSERSQRTSKIIVRH